jgi:hypothetical protein
VQSPAIVFPEMGFIHTKGEFSMNILNQIESGNTIFTFLDGGILQLEWIDTGGQKCFAHYQQVASDRTNWAEGVRAPDGFTHQEQ